MGLPIQIEHGTQATKQVRTHVIEPRTIEKKLGRSGYIDCFHVLMTLPLHGIIDHHILKLDMSAAEKERGSQPELEVLGKSELAQYRSEEHTSELQSRQYLVCRLLLEKKKNTL